MWTDYNNGIAYTLKPQALALNPVRCRQGTVPGRAFNIQPADSVFDYQASGGSRAGSPAVHHRLDAVVTRGRLNYRTLTRQHIALAASYSFCQVGYPSIG